MKSKNASVMDQGIFGGKALAFWQLIGLVLAVVSTLLLEKTIILLSPTPIG
jgi:hypothetical protein